MSFNLERAIREVVAQDTVYDSSNLDTVRYLKDLMGCFDFSVVEQTMTLGDAVYANIIGAKGPSNGTEGLVLSSPLDTLPSGPVRNWTSCGQNPLLASEADGIVFGLGTCGGKVDLLCKLKAAASFRTEELRAPIYLVGTFGRFLDFLGSRTLLETKLISARTVMVGDATNLELIRSTKGVLRFLIETRGKKLSKVPSGVTTRIIHATSVSSHAPFLGTNAIQQLLSHAADLDKQLVVGVRGGNSLPHSAAECRIRFAGNKSSIGSPAESSPNELTGKYDFTLALRASAMLFKIFAKRAAALEPTTDFDFWPPDATLNLNHIESDDGVLRILGDARFLPEHDVSELLETLQGDVKRIAKECGVTTSFEIKLGISPMLVDENDSLLTNARQALSAIGLVPVCRSSSGLGEAALYDSFGYQSLGFGPGWSIAGVANSNEGMHHSQLSKAVAFYREMIKRYCL